MRGLRSRSRSGLSTPSEVALLHPPEVALLHPPEDGGRIRPLAGYREERNHPAERKNLLNNYLYPENLFN